MSVKPETIREVAAAFVEATDEREFPNYDDASRPSPFLVAIAEKLEEARAHAANCQAALREQLDNHTDVKRLIAAVDRAVAAEVRAAAHQGAGERGRARRRRTGPPPRRHHSSASPPWWGRRLGSAHPAGCAAGQRES
jgi:hypothetical protein